MQRDRRGGFAVRSATILMTARPCSFQSFDRQNGKSLMLTFGNTFYVVHYNGIDLPVAYTTRGANLTGNFQRVRYTFNLATAHRGAIKPTGVLYQGAT